MVSQSNKNQFAIFNKTIPMQLMTNWFNIFFYDKDLALRIKEIYLNDEKDCVDIEEIRDYTHRSFATRLWESIVRLLSPLL